MRSPRERATRLSDYFDLRSGVGGAVIMGALVWWVNADHGAGPASIAALKQGAYTFLFGGLIVRLCQTLAEREGLRRLRLGVAVAVPSLITVVLVYAVHSTRGTPEPLLSTLPAALLGPPSFAFYAWRTLQAAPDRRGTASAPPPAH